MPSSRRATSRSRPPPRRRRSSPRPGRSATAWDGPTEMIPIRFDPSRVAPEDQPWWKNFDDAARAATDAVIEAWEAWLLAKKAPATGKATVQDGKGKGK